MHTDRDGYARAGEAMLATGTTAYQPTFITAPEDDLLAALREMPRRAADGPCVIGAHVEGPFLSPRRLGVHPPSAQRAPDPALLERILDAGGVRQMTLAPELPGAFELIDLLLERGVVVSAGHTDASAAEAHLAFDRGVRTVTHLFNAMRPLVPRDPGIALAALARARRHDPADRRPAPRRRRHAARRLAGGARADRARHRRGRGDRDGRRRLRARRAAARVGRGRRARARGAARRQRADDDRRRAQRARARDPAGGGADRGLGRAGADRGPPRPRPARPGRAGRRRRARRQPRDRPRAACREATVSLVRQEIAEQPAAVARVLADAGRRDRRRGGGDPAPPPALRGDRGARLVRQRRPLRAARARPAVRPAGRARRRRRCTRSTTRRCATTTGS